MVTAFGRKKKMNKMIANPNENLKAHKPSYFLSFLQFPSQTLKRSQCSEKRE